MALVLEAGGLNGVYKDGLRSLGFRSAPDADDLVRH